MREILFRGKRVDNDEWATGYLVRGEHYIYETEITAIYPPDTIFYPNTETTGYDRVFPETVGQYTGLTDKNGKKIFEGDILRYTWDTLSGEKKPYTYVISYNNKEARFIGECDSDDLQHLLPTFKYVGERGEVIGNVYDNKEKQND